MLLDETLSNYLKWFSASDGGGDPKNFDDASVWPTSDAGGDQTSDAGGAQTATADDDIAAVGPRTTTADGAPTADGAQVHFWEFGADAANAAAGSPSSKFCMRLPQSQWRSALRQFCSFRRPLKTPSPSPGSSDPLRHASSQLWPCYFALQRSTRELQWPCCHCHQERPSSFPQPSF